MLEQYSLRETLHIHGNQEKECSVTTDEVNDLCGFEFATTSEQFPVAPWCLEKLPSGVQ